MALIIGPMFSGKTTEVCRLLRRASCAKAKTVLVTYIGDTRYAPPGAAATHDGLVDASAFRVVAAARLADVALATDERDVGVDEGQFYPDLAEVAARWAAEGRRVHVAALDGDFRRRMFPPVAALIPLSTSVVKLAAVCMVCRDAEATSTWRIGASEDLEVIGAEEAYRAVCLCCYEGLEAERKLKADALETVIPVAMETKTTDETSKRTPYFLRLFTAYRRLERHPYLTQERPARRTAESFFETLEACLPQTDTERAAAEAVQYLFEAVSARRAAEVLTGLRRKSLFFCTNGALEHLLGGRPASLEAYDAASKPAPPKLATDTPKLALPESASPKPASPKLALPKSATPPPGDGFVEVTRRRGSRRPPPEGKVLESRIIEEIMALPPAGDESPENSGEDCVGDEPPAKDVPPTFPEPPADSSLSWGELAEAM